MLLAMFLVEDQKDKFRLEDCKKCSKVDWPQSSVFHACFLPALGKYQILETDFNFVNILSFKDRLVSKKTNPFSRISEIIKTIPLKLIVLS